MGQLCCPISLLYAGETEVLKKRAHWVIYLALAVLSLLTLYSIFNAGNPRSFFRLIVPDPAYDITITMFLAVGVALLSLTLFAGRQDDPLKRLIEINRGHIIKLREKGKSDWQIAESLLKELGYKKGLLFSLARRKILRYLARIV